jgi:hypothetical protein
VGTWLPALTGDKAGIIGTDRSKFIGGGREFTEFLPDNLNLSEGGVPVKRQLQEVLRSELMTSGTKLCTL